MAESRLEVLLPTLGSAGDVHPVLAIGMALKDRGHRTTVVTNEVFEEQVRDSGLEFIALGSRKEAEEAINDPRLWHPTKGFECIAERVIIPTLPRLYRIIEKHRSPKTVVASSALCFGARIAQEKLGVPLATVDLQPSLLRSVEDGGRQGRLPMHAGVPRWIKRGLFWLIDKGWIDRLLAPAINQFRAELGLRPVRRVFGEYLHSPQMVIGLFPEWFAPVQKDWPQHTHLAGFVLHDDAERQAIGPDVEAFMSSGAPPIVFTPGSAAATLHNFFRESVEACKIGGHRAMLVTNFPEQVPRNLPEGVRVFPYLPFSKVLPRCAALVYPGGIGTMAQAIKAGIPHFVVPHGHDQPDNALRITRLGLGESVYPEKYKAARVSAALKRLTSSAEVARRCAEFAPKIDSGNALARACGWIESLGARQVKD